MFRTIIDDSQSIVDNSRGMFQLVASFTIVIYHGHIFIVQATGLILQLLTLVHFSLSLLRLKKLIEFSGGESSSLFTSLANIIARIFVLNLLSKCMALNFSFYSCKITKSHYKKWHKGLVHISKNW